MMSYLISIGILLLLLVLTVFAFCYISGLFEKVKVERKQPPVFMNEVMFAYKTHTGPYNEVGYLFTEAYALDSKCIQCGVRSLEVCLEPTDGTEPEPEKAAVGAIILPDSDSETKNAFVQAGFQLTHLPCVHESLVACFPHISFLSIVLGSRRLFRCMRSYVNEHNLKVNTIVELYDGHYIHCIGLFEKDEAKFRQLINPTETVIDTVTVDATPSSKLESESNTGIDEPVETIPKPEEMLPALVQPTEAVQGDDDKDSDPLDDSFEKISVEMLMEDGAK